MANISYKASMTMTNRYGWNGGNEYEDEGELNYSNTFYRKYDAQIGRFTGIDILAEKFAFINPYQFGYCNPVMFNDPMGDEPGDGRMRKGQDGVYRPDWVNDIMFGDEALLNRGGSGGGIGSGGRDYSKFWNNVFANIGPESTWKDGTTNIATNGIFHYGNQMLPEVIVTGTIRDGLWNTSKITYPSNYGVNFGNFQNFGNMFLDKFKDIKNWVSSTNFVAEGEAKFSLGVQLGFKRGIFEVDAGYNTIDLGSLKGDFRNNKYSAVKGEMIVRNFANLEIGYKNTDAGLGGKLEYSYPYYNGYYGPQQWGDGKWSWGPRLPFKDFGPEPKGVARPDIGIGFERKDGKTFFGIDAGFGARLIFGIDLNLKVGIIR
jgi:RHS repeat-associated protein